MKIAICDDTLSDLENLKNNLLAYLNDANIKYTIEGFIDCNKLLNHIKVKDCDYDIIILDVVMQRNGIDVAKDIRLLNENVIIIFETSSKEFAIDAFKVQAYDYLVKPITYDEIKRCFDKLIAMLNEKQQRHLINVKTMNHTKETIDINDICYIESNDRRMIYHLYNGEDIYTTSLRNKFLESIPFDLDKYNFVNCHSSFIVNLNYIKSINNDLTFVLKKGEIIPISKRLSKQVKNKYVSYLVGDNNG